MFTYSHELEASDQSYLKHEYNEYKEPKQSTPHQSSPSGEQYAVSLNAVNNTAENQQQQVPTVEYAEIDNNKNKTPQQYNLTNGYDELNGNRNTDSKEVSIIHYCYNIFMLCIATYRYTIIPCNYIDS